MCPPLGTTSMCQSKWLHIYLSSYFYVVQLPLGSTTVRNIIINFMLKILTNNNNLTNVKCTVVETLTTLSRIYLFKLLVKCVLKFRISSHMSLNWSINFLTEYLTASLSQSIGNIRQTRTYRNSDDHIQMLSSLRMQIIDQSTCYSIIDLWHKLCKSNSI